ncbi:MAG: SPOR domain-containing protein [Sphingomonadales bacterium]|nr:SPOR domain-containing protein [Sphingomonadales bacterium]
MTATLSARPHRPALRLALGSALAGVLLAAPLQGVSARNSPDAARVDRALAHGDVTEAIALGEAQVARAPGDAAVHAALGHAYLRGGRFDSAMAVLSDAVALGDASARTLLGLALAQLACGQDQAARVTLDRGQAVIAPADLGLALALAGDTGRGIAVLTDSVRIGEADAKLRQNLAYAYALDGRWADARLAAGFDLPPDQADARVQQWAASMQPGAGRERIAQLLGVPLVADAGHPAALAADGAKPAPAAQLAAASPRSDADGQLPAVEAAPRPAPVFAAPAAAAAVPIKLPPTLPQAISTLPQVTYTPPQATPATLRAASVPATPRIAMVSHPVVEALAPAAPVSSLARPVPARPVVVTLLTPPAGAFKDPVRQWTMPLPRERREAPRPAPAAVAFHSTHVIQLGAFGSEAGAERARALFARRDSSLRGHDFRITRAEIHGRTYWRVVSAGFDQAQAAQTCSGLKHRGSACFAYAQDRAAPREALAMTDHAPEAETGHRQR